MKCIDMETITVGASVIALTPAKYQNKYIKEALISVEAGGIRITLNNTTAPNDGTKVGHLFPAGTSFTVDGADIAKMKMTRTATTDAVINVSYFQA
jgi:hypothetical protein